VSWVLVVVGFSLLIILHEAGHFAVAKWTGMRVERFFLFFPPRLWSVRRGETEYGIGMIPLGGFVKITGMNPEELEAAEQGEEIEKRGLLEQLEGADSGELTPRSLEGGEQADPEIIRRAYYNQPVWRRIAVIAAGPLVNIVLAFLILTVVFLSISVPAGFKVHEVQPGTPAAGVLQPGDRVLSVDGASAITPDLSKIGDPKRRFSASDDKYAHITNLIRRHHCKGDRAAGCVSATPVTMVVDRDGQKRTLHMNTFYDADSHRYRLGVKFETIGTRTSDQSLGQAAELSVDQMWHVTSQTMSKLAQIFKPEERKQLSGVVGTSNALNQAIDFSPRFALYILAVISLSLGVINLLPILPLDGGHIFWSLVEKIRGRRVPFSVIERATAVGFLLVIMLFVIGLTNDIGRLTD
jgi:regulator of sigma E protease